MGPGPNDTGLSRQHIVAGVEASLRRLRTDYVDLYQAHWDDRDTPLDETLRAFDDLVRQGKVRYIGASNYHAWRLARALWESDRGRYVRYESLHYYAAGEVVHREGGKQFTEGAHVPTPTKAIWLSNSNSQIANTKYHYDVVFNTLPRQECVAINEWWWSGSCEYADIVYGVDSWMELKYPDLTASNTNPFTRWT